MSLAPPFKLGSGQSPQRKPIARNADFTLEWNQRGGSAMAGSAQSDDTQVLLRQGIAALTAGDLPRAQALLSRLVLIAPDDYEGWWWLGQSLPDQAKRGECFRRVLALNPSHEGARQMLAASGDPSAGGTAPRDRPAAASNTPVSTAGTPMTIEAAPAPRRIGRSLGLAIGIVSGLLVFGLMCGLLSRLGGLDAAARAMLPFVGSGLPQVGEVTPAIYLPQVWTPTATRSPGPATATPEPETAATATPPVLGTETYEQRLLAASGDLQRAATLAAQEKYAESVLAWDEVLRQVPDYGEGHYQRARVNLELTENQRMLSEYQSLLWQAYEDIDLAISLGPVVTGDHYYTRFQILDLLAVDEPYFSDRKQIWTIALENLERSLVLGNSFAFSERALPFLYAALGDWRKGLEETQRQIRARGPSAPQSCDLNTALAENYQVAGRYSDALRHIDIAIGVCPTYRALLNRARILYNLGRFREARSQLDAMIEKDPEYGGERYFMRALISLDEGKLDEARSDWEFGSGQTWSTDGLYAYLAGSFAAAEGDVEQAIEWLRYAYATLGPVGTTPLLRRIESELDELGSTPIMATPRGLLVATSMPTLEPSITPRSPGLQMAPTPPDTRLVDMRYGTGPLLIRPGDFPSFRFQPSSRVTYDTVESLTVYLLGPSPMGIPTLQLSPWDPEQGGSGLIDSPVWGANPVRHPESYLTPSGDFFLSLRNWGEKPIQLDNLGVILVVRQKDGTRVTYGLGEN